MEKQGVSEENGGGEEAEGVNGNAFTEKVQ